MVAPIRFLSGRQQQQKIGIEGSTENQKVLEVIGQVGIGTTIFEPSEQLDVRGSVSVADTITASTINATTVVVTGSGSTFSDLTVTGIATFNSDIDANAGLDVDGHTELDSLNVSGLSTFGQLATYNGGINVVIGGIESNSINVSGLSTFTGIATFADNVFIAGVLQVGDTTFGSDIETRNLSVSGVSTFTGAIDANGDLDVDGHTELDDLNVSGVATFAQSIVASGGVTGDLTGNADTATTLATARNFSITGDVVAGSVTFDGSGDVVLNTEIQSNSVELGTDTTGDYVESISGAANQITVTGGTGEGSTPTIGLNGVVSITTSVTVGSLPPNQVTISESGINVASGIITGTLDKDLTLTTSGTGLSGIATYNNSGVTTFTVTSNATDANTADTIVARDGSGNFSAGTITADLTGVASTATQLENARDFSITGDFVTASAVSFDGSGNVSLAATITADSIELGTYTSGNYVQSVTGTANQITVLGGLGEGAGATLSIPSQFTAPQDATVTRDLTVQRDLYVDGNVTIGGTSATIFAQTLEVSDADLILGVRTDGSGNDVANDTTANHGGIAIASTEGTPLVDLYVAGIETVPTTYKKIMWFKAGTFAGLGTDAWLSNYAVGIGSTQFPTGTRLAAGNVQITEDDISVVRNINASGIITGTLDNTLTLATSGNGISGSATYDNSGAVTFTVTSDATDANTAETIVHRDASGNFSAGTITASLSGNVTGNVTGNLTGTATTATNLSNAANITTGTISSDRLTGSYDINITGTATTATNLADGANITTGTISDDRLPDIITSNINATSGVSTISQVIVGSAVTITSSGINASTGIVTALQFVGTASTASFAATAFTLNGTAEGGLSVGSAVTATNIAGGDTGDIPYQSAANTTTFVDASSAGSGQVLLWNGAAPEWGNVSSAAGAFGGVTIKDEGSTVGTAGSVATLNFVGSNIEATATTGDSGISTITLSDTPTFTELTVTGITSVSNFEVSGVSTFSSDVNVGSAITMQASTGIISATAFYGSGENLTDLINQRIEGIRVFEESSAVGTGYTIAALQFIGNNVTAAAVGLGTTVSVTFSDTPTFDSLEVTGISTLGNLEISASGILTAVSGIVTYYGDGQYLQNIITGVSISTNTTNQSQYLTYAVSTGSTTGLGVTTTNLVYNPSTNRLGIGTASPQATLHVVDELLVSTAGAASTQRITQRAYTTDNGTLSWEGSAGQLFSVTNNLTSGSIFSVNDVSGIPSIDVDADGTIQLAPYGSTEFVGIGTTNPTVKLHVIGDARISGAVTATSFVGDGSGLTNLPSTGAATTITLADESSDTTCFPIFATDATGDQTLKTDSSALTYNASTGALSATSFVGSLTGTATTATNITLADESSDTTCFPIFATDATGNQAPKTDSSALTYNASTGALSATSFVGDLTGDVTGTATTATTATNATNITVADESSDTACNVVFTTAATGNLPPKTGTNLTFDSADGILKATRYENITPARAFFGGNIGVALTTSSGMNISAGFVGLGYGSLQYITATGSGGGSNVCGAQVAVGYECLRVYDFNTGGGGSQTSNPNVVMGYQSGDSYTITSNDTARNVIVGYRNVYENDFGGSRYNSVFGVESAYKLSGGAVGNAIFGYQSGYNVTTGDYNTLLGYQAGYSVQTGQYNIGIGYSAGQANMTGSRNIVIGYNRDVPNAAGNDQLVIGSNANDWIIGDSSYNVGIGTDAINTSVKLTVGGAVTATTYYGDGSNLSGIVAGVTLAETSTDAPYYITFADSTGLKTQLGVTTASLVYNPSTTRLGIGTTNPTTKLHVIGEVTATDYNSTSDARLKTNVQVIDNPLDKISQINGVSFNWIESNKPSMGVIADEVEKVLPELVSDTDPKTVNYNGLIGLLIECVKKQQEEIEELKKKI